MTVRSRKPPDRSPRSRDADPHRPEQQLAERPGSAPPRPLALVGSDRTQDELLYARLLPTVNRLIWTFMGADAGRDDLVHDVFVRIFAGISRLRDPGRVEQWALRITMNSIKKEFRRRKFRRWFALDPNSDANPRFHPDFDGREMTQTAGVARKSLQRRLTQSPAQSQRPD